MWNLNIISININGMASNPWSCLTTLARSRHDIFLLQETKIHCPEQMRHVTYIWEQRAGGKCFISPAAANRSGGIAILFSNHATKVISELKAADSHIPNRYMVIHGRIKEQLVHIHSIYAPVERQPRPAFFRTLPVVDPDHLHIVGGDFNCAIDPAKDSMKYTLTSASGVPDIIEWMGNMDLQDIWRTQHPEEQVFTSPSRRHRLDYILVSAKWAERTETKIGQPMGGSDHRCPQVSMGTSATAKGKGHWQMPIWLAERAAKETEGTLAAFSAKPSVRKYEQFDALMQQLTRRCRNLHRQAVNKKNQEQSKAYNMWRRCHYEAVANPTPAALAEAVKTRAEWRRIATRDEIKNKADAFDRHFHEAEKVSRSFLRAPFTRHISRGIAKARRTDGTITENREEIGRIHSTFWRNVFSANGGGTEIPPSEEAMNKIADQVRISLTDEQRNTLDEAVTTTEVRNAIKAAAQNKAAGSDGLRAEFFQHGENHWAIILADIVNEIMQRKRQLPRSLRTSIIVLLYKKGTPEDAANYRPIALVNVAAKIITSIFCTRLKPILKHLVPPSQTGFIPGREITENLIIVQDIMHWAKSNCKSATLLCLDFEKAYDRVQWPYMKRVLRKQGFGAKWMNLIETIYSGQETAVSINGMVGKRFEVSRGVLQGDPISPFLFVLQMVPLSNMLESLRQTHGIETPDGSILQTGSFYADDSTIIARSPEAAAELYAKAEDFCRKTGAVLHPEKCVAIPVTSPETTHLPNGIRILQSGETTNLLGVPIGPNVTREQQVTRVLSKMLERCHQWENRARSVQGRGVIATTMILSSLWYVLSALPLNQPEITKIQNVVTNFMNKERDFEIDGKVKRGQLSKDWYHLEKDRGGWGLPYVVEILETRKLGLMRKYFQARAKGMEDGWLALPKVMATDALKGWLTNSDDITMWRPSRGTHNAPGEWNKMSQWWRDAWTLWHERKWYPKPKSVNMQALRKLPVWNNRLIPYKSLSDAPLHRSANGTQTKQRYKVYRALGFLHFDNFLTADDKVISSSALEDAINDELTRRPMTIDHVTPRSCSALTRHVANMWAYAKEQWLSTRAEGIGNTGSIKWMWQREGISDFKMAKNRDLRKLVKRTRTIPHISASIGVEMNSVISTAWKAESQTQKWLLPSRKDLLMRLQRNGLPVGSKRKRWGEEYQSTCVLCPDECMETVEHLFWECQYAKGIWVNFEGTWRPKAGNTLTWKNILLGTETHIPSYTLSGKVWTIIRACVLRVVWLERNLRIFNPNRRGKTPMERANQAGLDIRAHIESAMRRSDHTTRAKIAQICDHLRANTHYDNIINAHLLR